MNSPSDAGFRLLIDQINSHYANSGISFTTEDECIHRLELPEKSSSMGVLRTDLGIPSLDIPFEAYKIPEDTSVYIYKNDFINVFIFQNGIGGGNTVGNDNFRLMIAEFNAKVIAHELGHSLSLLHTGTCQNFNDPTTWECIGGDASKADRMPDTDADPSTMDLDGNGSSDDGLWYNNNCAKKSSLNSMNDQCGNNNWNPPYTNFMNNEQAGVTRDCWNHFTPCQISAMHYELDNIISDFIGSYGEGTNQNSCHNNILIDSSVTWTDDTIFICPRGRITITPNGSLTLINTIVTKSINLNCPELSATWDGIYISPASYGSSSGQGGGGSAPSGGKLFITQGSLIEYSDNGIQAPGSHNGITISGSKLENNGMAIYSKGSGPFVGAGRVLISGSEIKSKIGSKPVILRMDGSNLTVQSGSIITNLADTGVTAIKSFNGKLTIKNSTIKDFEYGVDEEMNGGQGMTLQSSHFLGNMGRNVSVRNRNAGVTANKNLFQGFISHVGNAYGNFYANNLKKRIDLYNPRLSYAFRENNFDNASISLKQNQSLTDATCNQWINSSNATQDSASVIKSSWGSDTLSSGNKHDGSMPEMQVRGSNEIKHYHYDPDELTVFTYDGQFVGGNANTKNTSCNYGLFPVSLTNGGGSTESPYDNIENNQSWVNLNQQLIILESQLSASTGAELQALIRSIENVNVAMGLSVLTALQNIDPIESSSSYNTWLSRADYTIQQQIDMISYWNNANYSGLITYLNGLSLNSEESLDRTKLIEGLNTLIAYQSQAKNLNQLNEQDLEIIIDKASVTFGSYTSLLRAWLNIQYDIRIDPPQFLNQNTRKDNRSNKIEANNISLIPNPTDDCIQLIWSGEVKLMDIQIYDLTGRLRYSSRIHNNSSICLKSQLGSGLYIIQISSFELEENLVIKKIIVE